MPLDWQYNTKKPEYFEDFYDGLCKKSTYQQLEIIENKDFPLKDVSVNDLYFETDDRARIHVKYCYPTSGEIKKVILVFHGYHVSSGAWFDKIAYAKLGFAVLAMDVRGQSGLSTDVNQTAGSTLKGLVIKGVKEGYQNLYYTQIYMDTYRLANLAKALHPNIPLVSMGESQGGALAAISAALTPDIELCLIHHPYLVDIEHAYELGCAYDGIENYFKWEDPLGKSYTEFFQTLSYIDLKFFASRIRAELHLFTGKKDKVSPLECQMSFYHQVTSKKELYLYPEKGHEYLDGAEDIKLKLLLRSEI
ncbi:MAG: acetylxylan esterase [Lactovum sp.]